MGRSTTPTFRRKTGITAAAPSTNPQRAIKRFHPKTEDCFNFRKYNKCKYGEKCRYRHQDRPVDEECRSWMKKSNPECNKERCRYRHSKKTRKGVDEDSKHNGVDPSGANCGAMVGAAPGRIIRRDDNIYIDSGTTYTVTNNPADLENQKKSKNTANTLGGPISFEKEGVFHFYSRTKKGNLLHRVPEAQLGPDEGLNLLSLGQLDRMRYKGEFGGGKMEIFDPSRPERKLITAHLTSNNLYKVDRIMKPSAKSDKQIPCAKQMHTLPENLEIPNSGGTGTFVNSNGNNNSADTLKTNHGDVSNSESSFLLRAFEEIEDQEIKTPNSKGTARMTQGMTQLDFHLLPSSP